MYNNYLMGEILIQKTTGWDEQPPRQFQDKINVYFSGLNL